MGLCFPQIMHGLVPTTVPLLEKMRLAGQMGYHGLGVAVWDLESFKEQHGDLAAKLNDTSDLDEDLDKQLCEVITRFAREFRSPPGHDEIPVKESDLQRAARELGLDRTDEE